jgi:hypothetical protein
MMKRFLVSAVLCAMSLGFFGCSQPGETALEGKVRHQRNMSLSRQQFMRDVDNFLLTDEPSKLSEMRIP